MATGASTAKLAVVLIDARKGVITQTKRHSFIVSLLGIQQVVVAINKMDLVDYSEEVFARIRKDFEEFSREMDFEDIYFIPLSALKGDNVVNPSSNTPWYTDEPLLPRLEKVPVHKGENFTDFRYPVQYVNRPTLDFRGFSGTVASGAIHRGDKIQVLPSRRETTVQEIVTADGSLDSAFAGQAVTLVLSDEVDISSGDMLVHPHNPPQVRSLFEAVTVWMSESPLHPGTPVLLRHCGRTIKARVDSLVYAVNVNTLEKEEANSLPLNGIGRIRLSTTQPIYIDPFSKNPQTGAFIIIDPLHHGTVAAGMVLEGKSFDDTGDESLEAHVQRREFFWETGLVTQKKRHARYGHRGKTVLCIGTDRGLKRDIARALEKYLFSAGFAPYYLGMSNIKGGLDSDVQDASFNRDEHIRRLGELSRILTDAGLIFITPLDLVHAYDLKQMRHLAAPHEFFVISCGDTPLPRKEINLILPEDISVDKAVIRIYEQLKEEDILPEYTI
ncbi:sulfate adenylyltransferase large subunit [Chitinivibrio alkaliphilus ACht1]|uniref:sulfate adenylyltransferase n=2 Tax=Chitinivibrio TaxID=1505231 RepID=U7D9D6_9BACT|nr:sulfate adenylyltransferase large subunit [Chitinivibrio alkaliphilus ACht1]